MANELVTSALKHGDILPLMEFPRELLNSYELEIIDWISDYVMKYSSPPPVSRLAEQFPYWIPISYDDPDDEPPLLDIRDQTLKRKLRAYWEGKLTDALSVLHETGELPKEEIDEIQRVTAMSSGVSRFSSFDRTKYIREKGLDVGLRLINRATGGVGKGEVMVVAGRLGTGKTMMSLFFAYAWLLLGKRILFISNEMLPPDIFARMDGIVGKFSPLVFRTGEREHLESVVKSCTTLARSLVEDTGGEIIVPTNRLSTPRQVFALAKHLRVDAVIIDGMYLMRTEDRFASKWERVAAVSNEVKQQALATEMPVIGLVQIKRTGGKKDVYDPEDIAYSDAIGQDADFVLAINPGAAIRERLELQLIKNRFGPEVATVCTIDFETMTLVEESVASKEDEDWLLAHETVEKLEAASKKRGKAEELGTFLGESPDDEDEETKGVMLW